MNEHLDENGGYARGERELTLSTGAILGIFFGLVILCGVCFGVGYNMGRKSTPTPLALNDVTPDASTSDSTGGGSKPSAGSPLDGTSTVEQPAPSIAATPPAPKPVPVPRKPAPVVSDTEAATPETVKTPPTRTPVTTAANVPAPIVRAVPPSALMPGAAPASTAGIGSIMVQIAAVSHQEDADLLVGALRSRGYSVIARPASSDGFIHVQVGPFSDKKAAEAMKQRLLGDGYNAILK